MIRCLALALFILSAASAFADVKLRPGDKPVENSKDFFKDKEKNGYPTPEPQSRNYPFVTGGQVTVELEAATSFLGAVKFSIKDVPLHGTLSEIRAHPSGESNKALITYTHGGDSEQPLDRFTFQAKIGDGNTSPAGTITLTGKRAAPQIEVLEHPKFKRLAPGESDSGRVVLLNTGTAPFAGEVKWPAPFVGPPTIELGIKEKLTLLVMIKPEAPGTYRLNHELQAAVPSSRVMGMVECLQPYSVEPSQLMLKFDPEKGNRSGIIKVSNGSDAPLALELEANARLLSEKSLSIPAHEAREVAVSLDPQDVAPFRGEFWVKQGAHRDKIVVQADAEPAQLKLESPKEAALAFGRLEKGKTAEATFTLKNKGGVAALTRLISLPAPFVLADTSAEQFSVPIGGTKDFKVTYKPETVGDHKAKLILGADGDAGVEIALSGSMFDPKRPGSMTPAGVANPHAPPTGGSTTSPRVATSPRVPTTARNTEPKGPDMPASLRVVPQPAPVAPAPAPAPPPSSSASGNGEGRASGSAIAAAVLATQGLGLEMLPMLHSATLKPVPAVGLTGLGKDFAEIIWKEPEPTPVKYRVERSRMNRNDHGIFYKSWEEVKWTPATSPAGTKAARIEGLTPNRDYEWRVLGIDREGKLSAGSDFIVVTTHPEMQLRAWVWAMMLAVPMGIGYLVWRRVREQRGLAV